MEIADSKELLQIAGQLRDDFRAHCARNGTNTALRDVSQAIREIQKIFPDVRLEIFGDCSQQAFTMFRAGCEVPISGILHIGGIHKLFAIATEEEEKPVLKIALSNFDIRFQGNTEEVTATVFDLNENIDAIKDFQSEIISHCARNEVVHENDIAGTFEKPEIPEQVKFATLKGLSS